MSAAAATLDAWTRPTPCSPSGPSSPEIRRALLARRAVRRAVHRRRALDRHLLPAELPCHHAARPQRELLPHRGRGARGGVARVQALPARRGAGLPRLEPAPTTSPARAMRLITDGVVERDGVPGLASRLGYTPRHLTRVLQRRARCRSARARPSAPGADRAHAAGIHGADRRRCRLRSRVRQHPPVQRHDPRGVRDDADCSCARSPGDGGRVPEPTSGAAITLRLPARAPFDGAGVLAHLGGHLIPGVESFEHGVFRRLLRLPGGPGRGRGAARRALGGQRRGAAAPGVRPVGRGRAGAASVRPGCRLGCD